MSEPSAHDEIVDYTDGASPVDIQNAIRENSRGRGDLQVGSSYRPRRSMSSFRDEEGARGSIFDGPDSVTIPSSVTGLRRSRTRSIQSASRRQSREFDSSYRRRDSTSSRPTMTRRATENSEALADTDDESNVLLSSQAAWPIRKSVDEPSEPLSTEDTRIGRTSSVFGSFANFFARRESPSRRSNASRSRRESVDYTTSPTEEELDDRWGYHSSEEDASEEETMSIHSDDAYPASSRGSISSLRPASPATAFGLGRDPIFGDTRVDMDDISMLESIPATGGPPSRQDVYLSDEDLQLRLIGYAVLQTRNLLWKLATFSSFGILALAGHWFPEFWLRCVAIERPFTDKAANIIVVENPSKDIIICPTTETVYPYSYASTFPGSGQDTETAPSSTTETRPPSSIKLAPIAPSAASTSSDHSIMLKNLRMFDYRHNRYILDPQTGRWVMIKDWKEKSASSISETSKGLAGKDRIQRQLLFGSNVIDIKGKSVVGLLVDEVVHPFYVFQIASIVLWSMDNYFYYAFCIGIISMFSIMTTLIETRQNIIRMREMARFTCPVTLITKDATIIQDSNELVPGDIVNLTKPMISTFPCDIILLSGDAIVNESMLTGESVPVSKSPIKNEDLQKWRQTNEVSAEIAKSMLYSGTKVVRIRGPMQGSIEMPAIGLVVRTAFNTTKGALVRSMLFPKPMGFKFYRDSMRFIAVLAGIAVLGFLISAVQFVRLGVPWQTIVLRAFDLITIVVPPALPATLSIGTSFAIARLRAAGIFCISPNRVNVGGKVNVLCFDKTGTLTEDGLDILGARALERDGRSFREVADNVLDIPVSSDKANLLHAMATCHSLKVVNGDIVGDPLDAKMFEFTGWTLEENTTTVPLKKGPAAEGTSQQTAPLVQNIVRPPGTRRFTIDDALKGDKRAHFLELGVIRTFEFVSALRRTSVITKRLRSKSMEIYLKGAPEILRDVCLRETFPPDYEDLLAYYTKNGYRVIGIAGKSVEGLSWLKAQRMKREQVEVDLHFLGLLIFENKLKPGTAPAIAALRSAHIGCRMVTGDNPRTAVSVARECKLINTTAFVFYPSFVEGDLSNPRSVLEWRGVDDESLRLDPYSLRPLPPPPHVVDEERIYRDYDLAITGDVFRWMIDYAPLETLQQMLYKTHVFARMSPDEKHELVERLQLIGYTVGFCGDGANDCGALKAADVGISLSEAEASVAAPFTSKTPDISCVIEVIREGRAALVTSFSCFKYMALYSLIQFTTITFLYSFASSLGDFQFLYIDLFIIIPIAVAMGRTLPFERIHPQRPTSSLVSRKVLSSIIGQIIINSVVQAWVFFWVRRQSFYQPPPPPAPGDLESHNYEDTALFLVSSFQYILVAGVFSIGPPYRRPMWTNGWLLACFVILGTFSTWVLLAPAIPVALILDLITIPGTARITLAFVVLLNIAASFAYEDWLADHIASAVKVLMNWKAYSKKRRREGRVYESLGR